MKAKFKVPSKDLLVCVRAAFVMKGTSFNAWCSENRVVRRTAEQSLDGSIQSVNAQKLVKRILQEANLADVC